VHDGVHVERHHRELALERVVDEAAVAAHARVVDEEVVDVAFLDTDLASATCDGDSECTVDVNGGNTASVSCGNGSLCNVHVENGSADVACTGSATCDVFGGGSPISMHCSSGGICALQCVGTTCGLDCGATSDGCSITCGVGFTRNCDVGTTCTCP
jgi:hypothetical protein